MYVFSEEERVSYERLLAPIAVFQYIDKKVVTLLVSDGLCALARTDRERLLDSLTNSMFVNVHPNDVGRIAKIGTDFAEKLCGYDEIYRIHINGDEPDFYRLIHTVGFWQVMSDGTELAFLTYIDITESEKHVSQTSSYYSNLQRDLFYSDPITELPNTNYLFEYANEKINKIEADGKSAVVVLFDVIGMNLYNLKYGYARGNKLLCLIAAELLTSFPDGLVTRGFDDHFIILTARDGIEKTIRKVNSTVKHDILESSTGIKAGIAHVEKSQNVMDAIDNARRAVRSIGSDLGVVYKFYDKSVSETYRRKRYILDTFDKAMQEGRICVFYQGIMRIRTGKVCSFEAIARWIEPDGKFIYPDEFIPVLEEFHLMYKLDLYMLENVCAEVHKRESLGFTIVPVSINFSGQDFDRPDLAEKISEIVDRHGIPHEFIIIEITEQTIAEGEERFRNSMENLTAAGFKIWVDDFGSGYSSLNVFGKYHFDLIKFDMELIRSLDANKGANRFIIKAIIGVARQLGIHTLGEGVEEKSQLDFLREAGCGRAQGFYFKKPAKLDDIYELWIKNEKQTPVESVEEYETEEELELVVTQTG